MDRCVWSNNWTPLPIHADSLNYPSQVFLLKEERAEGNKKMIYSRLLITSGWVSPREKSASQVSCKSLLQSCKYNTGQKGVLSPACNYPPGNQHVRRCWWCFQLIIFYYSWFSVSYNLWYFTVAPSTSSAIMNHCVNSAWRHGPTLPCGLPRRDAVGPTRQTPARWLFQQTHAGAGGKEKPGVFGNWKKKQRGTF